MIKSGEFMSFFRKFYSVFLLFCTRHSVSSVVREATLSTMNRTILIEYEWLTEHIETNACIDIGVYTNID